MTGKDIPENFTFVLDSISFTLKNFNILQDIFKFMFLFQLYSILYIYIYIFEISMSNPANPSESKDNRLQWSRVLIAYQDTKDNQSNYAIEEDIESFREY